MKKNDTKEMIKKTFDNVIGEYGAGLLPEEKKSCQDLLFTNEALSTLFINYYEKNQENLLAGAISLAFPASVIKMVEEVVVLGYKTIDWNKKAPIVKACSCMIDDIKEAMLSQKYQQPRMHEYFFGHEILDPMSGNIDRNFAIVEEILNAVKDHKKWSSRVEDIQFFISEYLKPAFGVYKKVERRLRDLHTEFYCKLDAQFRLANNKTTADGDMSDNR